MSHRRFAACKACKNVGIHAVIWPESDLFIGLLHFFSGRVKKMFDFWGVKL